jgi:hypothetical protein
MWRLTVRGAVKALQMYKLQNEDKAIYKQIMFSEWTIAINAYLELNGMFRYKEDPEWGCNLKRFRDGVPLSKDFDIINLRQVTSRNSTIDGDSLPDDVSSAVSQNKKRDSINAGLFSKYIETNAEKAFLIFSDCLGLKKEKKDRRYANITQHAASAFWNLYGESSCKLSRGTSYEV